MYLLLVLCHTFITYPIKKSGLSIRPQNVLVLKLCLLSTNTGEPTKRKSKMTFIQGGCQLAESAICFEH